MRYKIYYASMVAHNTYTWIPEEGTAVIGHMTLESIKKYYTDGPTTVLNAWDIPCDIVCPCHHNNIVDKELYMLIQVKQTHRGDRLDYRVLVPIRSNV
jgi:glutamate dehydrogenase/leucine dehydrogenase